VIFAREVTDSLTGLVKKIDKATAENRSARMGSFVVFLSNDEGLEQKLKDLAQKEGIKYTILTIDNPAGPPGYNIAKDADVTVLLYSRKTVKVNHAYRKGELKDSDADAILKELPKIMPGS
jgi:hypothetical protein